MRRAVNQCAAISGLLIFHAATLAAQCPDGTPPPCTVRLPARSAVSIPSAEARARRFLVLPFRNVTRQTQEDWLVEGSTTMLADAIGQWQGVTVVPDEKLYPALKRAGIAPGSVIAVTQVRRLSEETGGWTAVSGEVVATGGRVRITARAWDVITNRELVRASSEVAAGGDVRVAYDSVGLRLLRTAGVEQATSDLASASTRSIDAYQLYLRGLAHLRRSEVKLALTDFQESVKADSTFAMAWARLAGAQIATDPTSLMSAESKASQSSARAVALSSKLPVRQRQLVRAVDAGLRAQFGDVRQALEGLLATDSTDVDAMELMVGLEMFDPILVSVPGGQRPRGSPMRAARLAKRITELDPARYSMFGVLSSLYANAGIPNAGPVIGVDRTPSSYPDLMQTLRQREHLRVYFNVLRDTLVPIPAESISFIPKATLADLRKNARAVGRAWAERWIASAGNESAPHQMMTELLTLDGEYQAALRAMAKAESLGVQNPMWVVPARRLLLLGKSGDLTGARRLADSLTAAAFFQDANNSIVNSDAAAWAFAMHLLGGNLPMAGRMLEQSTAILRMLNPQNSSPAFSALSRLMGNEDPEEEPGLPRALRARELETALSRVGEFAASDQIGPWLPVLLPMLAEAAEPKAMRSADVLKAANVLATTGREDLAFQLASNMIATDSAAAAGAATYPWFRSRAEALNATRAARKARVRAGTAVVGEDRATFEWIIDDTTPFIWSLPETPPSRGEYGWDVRMDSPSRQLRFSVLAPRKNAGAPRASGTLEQLLPPSATRQVIAGRLGANGVPTDTTLLQGVALRTEFAPGMLRMVVTDRAIVDELRRARPEVARFRFSPCPTPVGSITITVCADERVTVIYR